MSLIKKFFKFIFTVALSIILFLLGLQLYFYLSGKEQIYSNAEDIPKADYAMILGCGVIENRPSPLLQQRLEAGLDLFSHQKVDKIILSGYRDGPYYDEVSVMKQYLLKQGVPEEKIIEDKQGDNTYCSIKNFSTFKGSSLILVTQKRHLERALYLSKKFNHEKVYGLEAKSYVANNKSAVIYMNLREMFARVKAVMDAYGFHLESVKP